MYSEMTNWQNLSGAGLRFVSSANCRVKILCVFELNMYRYLEDVAVWCATDKQTNTSFSLEHVGSVVLSTSVWGNDRGTEPRIVQMGAAAAVVTNRQKCACARVTRDLWFLVVGPNLSTRLYNFVIITTGHHFL
jgi:hypothetical protein